MEIIIDCNADEIRLRKCQKPMVFKIAGSTLTIGLMVNEIVNQIEPHTESWLGVTVVKIDEDTESTMGDY